MPYNYFRYWTYERARTRRPKKGSEIQEYVTILKTHLYEKYSPILDVGCGEGWYVRLFSSSCGVDINLNRLKHAKNLGTIVAQGNLLELPFPDKIFEASYTMQVLMHIPNHLIMQALKELLRVTQKKILHIEAYRKKKRKMTAHCFNHDLESLYCKLGTEMVYSKRLKTYKTQVCSIFAPEGK